MAQTITNHHYSQLLFTLNKYYLSFFLFLQGANGERRGGCPSADVVTQLTTLPNVHLSSTDACRVDVDCDGLTDKCCKDSADVRRCVRPEPGRMAGL